MRRLVRLAGLILALPLLYLGASVAGALIPGPGPIHSGSPARSVGLIQGWLHTDILLPLTPEIRARFAFAEASGVPVGDPRAAWLLVGWGARDFYTTAGTYADITAAALFSAATGDAAVLRLDALGPLPEMPELTLLALSEPQLQALMAGIAAAFARDATGRPQPLDHPGFSPTDAFFHAKGRFTLLRTCNVWLGQTLRAAGIRFGLWTPVNWSVRLALDWHLPGRSG